MNEIKNHLENAPVFLPGDEQKPTKETELLLHIFAKKFQNESSYEAIKNHFLYLLKTERIPDLQSFISICESSDTLSQLEEKIKELDIGFTRTDLINVLAKWYCIQKDEAKTIIYLLEKRKNIPMQYIPKMIKHCKDIQTLLHTKIITLEQIGLEECKQKRERYQAYLNLQIDEIMILKIIAMEVITHHMDIYIPIGDDICLKLQDNGRNY